MYFDPKRTKGPDDTDRIETGEIPQVAETYAYLNAAYPIMNEHQLAIGETTFGGKRELQSDNGIIDCPELYRLVLERAKTAREAIRIADELTTQYGYNDYGEAFTFADTNETWFFEILGPGKGKQGRRVGGGPDPGRPRGGLRQRAAHPEAGPRRQGALPRVGQRPLAGGGTRARGARASGEPFEFCTAYGSRSSLGSRRREWRALSRLAPSLKLDPNAEHYPLSVKAETKLSVKDVLDIFRDTYQDTPFDMTRSLIKVTPRREGGEEPDRQPVHEPGLPRRVQHHVGADDCLQARDLPAGHAVARLAAEPDWRRWSGWATTTR